MDKLICNKKNFALVPVRTSHISDKIVFRAIEKVDLDAEIQRLMKIPSYTKPQFKIGFKMHKIDYKQIT